MLSLTFVRQLALRSQAFRSQALCVRCMRQVHFPGSADSTPVDLRQPNEEPFPRTRARKSNVRRQKILGLPDRVNIKGILLSDETGNNNEKANPSNNLVSDRNDAGERSQGKKMKALFCDSPTMAEFQQKLQNYDGFKHSADDWKNFELEVCAENPDLLKKWDTMCMQLMYASGTTDLAASLITYLFTKSSSPNLATLCLYMALQGEYGGPHKEKAILDIFSKVQEITDIFDAITAKYVITGLSETLWWRQALDVLEMVKLTATPGPSYYCPIIIAALRHDVDFAFQLLDEIGLKGMVPHDNILQQVLHQCGEAEEHGLLERYLGCAWKFSWPLSPALAQQVETYFTKSPKEKWTCKWTNVDTVKGTCHACQQDMKRIEVGSSDFEALQREFLERAVVGSNVYLKSNPQEVDRFKDFVLEHAPFDIVLDALNIAFKRFGGTVAKSKQLREMVHYFAKEKHMRVLVIGRAHMKQWSAADISYIERHAKTFFTENISSDDPFCLYATLYSGKDTLFVSADFMRDHKFNLGQHRKEIFERWQKSRQIVNFQISRDSVSISMPSQYDCGPVKDSKGWHIPYHSGTADLRSSSQTVLCLRQKGQRAAVSSAKRNNKPKKEEKVDSFRMERKLEKKKVEE